VPEITCDEIYWGQIAVQHEYAVNSARDRRNFREPLQPPGQYAPAVGNDTPSPRQPCSSFSSPRLNDLLA